MSKRSPNGPTPPGGRGRGTTALSLATATVLLGGVLAAGSASAQSDAVVPGPGAKAADSQDWLPKSPDQWPLVVNASRTPDEWVTRGIQYHTDTYQTVGGTQHATELDVDLTEKNVRMGVVESHDRLTDPPSEVVSSMANRTGAVAGINGDFFNINATGRPQGMVVIDGRLVKSPSPSWNMNLVVRADGSIGMGAESYSATVTDGPVSFPLTSVNTVEDIASHKLVRLTPDLGAAGTIAASVVVAAHRDPSDAGVLVVDTVTPNVKNLATLPEGTEDLVGNGAAGTWLTANVHAGDRVSVAERISPDNAPQQALSGGAVLVKNGVRAVPLQGSGENNINDPVTALGVTQDGRNAVVAVFDGHQPEDTAEGLTRPQIAGWMMDHGAYNAILFDTGGSSEMVARRPGQTRATVANWPSDGHERPVANGLFFYSTETAPEPAERAVVNGGRSLAMLTGSTLPLDAYATDKKRNPASDPVSLSVSPSDLATVRTDADGTTITAADRPGQGTVTVRSGKADDDVDLLVTDTLASATISPTTSNLRNLGTQAFSVSAVTADHDPVALLPGSLKWTVTPSGLGSVDPATGVFTAAADGEGMATVTAAAGGASVTASVAVGQRSDLIEPMTDVDNWSLTPHSATASVSLSTTEKAQPSDAGSMAVHYSIPAGSGVKQIVISPKVKHAFPPAGTTQQPEAVGIWVKGTGKGGNGTPLGAGNLTLAESYSQVNGQAVTFYPSTVTHDGWRLIVADLPAGLQYPLTLGFVDFLVVSPTETLSGDLYLSDLQALYSPRPPAKPTYVPVPDNPDWLKFAEDKASFADGGTTIAALDDAHTKADDPGSTGSVVLKQDEDELKGLPQSLTGPLSLQALGDMSDNGTLPYLSYMKSLLDAGVPYHEMVGNHEITQGADPENKNWTSLFGATHYAYTQGAANVVVTDNSHGGILASDPFQVPANDPPQYQWLADQLTANTSPVLFVVTHMPAFDPHAVKNSQFADRWEAQMYEALVNKYQDSHPGVHVMMLFGHARGFAENILNGLGQDDPHGVPNFVIADAGMPAYAPVEEGGFYNYALFHVMPDGTVRFSVEPTLTDIDVTSPDTTLEPRQSVRLTATGTTPTGDDLAALHVPIADPASHVWRSSDTHVATVDEVTGEVEARHAGTVEISVESGAHTGSVTLTVTKG
ncbi:phosphodiester glycosidase family protein [Streptomyces sp. NPDC002574]|uniref:phosphodiester glycosidase family protein n=1 Tax=Streptomyces sp. NPDC002574 TaxID=3364652 RepID=UPI0036B7D3BF